MKKYFLMLICVLVYCLPLGAVVYISDQEKQKYVEDEDFNFEISSYGEVVPVERRDVSEYYIVDAEVVSIDEQSIELAPGTRLMCSINDEIEKEQVIASGRNGEVKADFDGIITDVGYEGEIVILKYYNFDRLAIETYLPEDKYELISSKDLQDEKGNKIELIKKSKILKDGMFRVILSIPEGTEVMYGKTMENFKLYTGVEYRGVLVVDKNCVYKNDKEYYVRKVDESGVYIGDYQVQVGFSDEKYICISGDEIYEGDFCDSGYSKWKEDGNETDEAGETDEAD